MDELFSIIVGFLIALVAIMVFEVLRKPRIQVELPQDGVYSDYLANPSIGTRGARFGHVHIFNRPLVRRGWFWIPRYPASNARCLVTVRDAEGRVVNNLQDIATKWSATVEPASASPLYFNPSTGRISFLPPNPSYFEYLVTHANIHSLSSKVEAEPVAIAFKIDGDNECFLFGGENYRSENQWRLQQRAIPQGEYVVQAKVVSDNALSGVYQFRLRNFTTNPQGLEINDLP